jgi:hypothetical protein
VSRSPFRKRGDVSYLNACLALIQETEEKEGFSYDVAVTEIRERTGIDDLELRDIRGSMLAASKALRAQGVPGVKNIRGAGWQRETAKDLLEDAVHRERKARHQVKWMGDSAKAADPEQLEWSDRQRRDEQLRKSRAMAELTVRRASRLRPLPPAANE